MITDEDAAITSRRVSLNEQISGRSSDRRLSLGDQFGRQGSIGANAAEIAKRVRNRVLAKGSTWTVPKPDMTGQLGMGSLAYLVTDAELLLLCDNAVRNKLWSDTNCVSVQAPVKVFGDIHGQFQDLLRFFDEYVAPEPYSGDIGYVHYLFLGDYVDRGTLSLEVIALLLALKTLHPECITLLRGNHEDREINADFGFHDECIRRCTSGEQLWEACNTVFDWLPLSAVIDDRILCIHGGLGGSLKSLDQLRSLRRPFNIDAQCYDEQTNLLYDILWSDPTEADDVNGVRPNARGEGVVRFGPDRVQDFCRTNHLQLVLRAHECVWDGFEYFAQGRLLTVFSCPDYGGRHANDGAMLVVNRSLEVTNRVRVIGVSILRLLCSRPHKPYTPRHPDPNSNQVMPKILCSRLREAEAEAEAEAVAEAEAETETAAARPDKPDWPVVAAKQCDLGGERSNGALPPAGLKLPDGIELELTRTRPSARMAKIGASP